MSKYDKLWTYVSSCGSDAITLTFDEIARIADTPVDHSFLTYKKELIAYGWRVGKISMKTRTIQFLRDAGE